MTAAKGGRGGKAAPAGTAGANPAALGKGSGEETPAGKAAGKASAKKASTRKPPEKTSSAGEAGPAAGPVLLSGGNPQIRKGYGDGPVQAYIAAMPGWKSAIGRQLDAIVTATVPGVAKAVKWNSPLYGVQGDGWFLGLHCFNAYVKVSFFRGARLVPPPPGPSKQADVRYLDIREDGFDEARFADWVAQASRLPGEKM